MKTLKNIGLGLFVVGMLIFTASSFIGKFEVTQFDLEETLTEQQRDNLLDYYSDQLVGQSFTSPHAVSSIIVNKYEAINKGYKDAGDWDNVMWDSPHVLVATLMKKSSVSGFVTNSWLWLFLTFGLGVIGGLLWTLPDFINLGPAGIKNDHVYQNASTNKGWIAYIVFGYLVSFYITLYFFPEYLVNQVSMLDPISQSVSGNDASQWFLYGFLYCVVMVVMSIRMYVKYRHNMYQVIRTTSVLFFQIAFAFIIPELLVRFNMPYMDFKNAWPLDYDFFYDWNLDKLIANGAIGYFMIFWGVALTIVVVPVMVYFFGKRWYCSWVCGCGGLAETLGDPYRQHSDKSLKAWKIERWLIHGVLVFAVIMTAATLITYFTGWTNVFGISTFDLQKYYGFLIGSIFSGVIGTGFYPIFGNRVWCRFGCPLAAYMGLVQRFKSRFRITTNGGQCISCGNCSTYCEQGIDVRAYAQKGENIVRSSCVGCGVCAAVCPRGVLKLENGPEIGRITDFPGIEKQ